MSYNTYRSLDRKWLLLAAGLVVLALMIYVGFRVYYSERTLIPISVIALMAGVLYEGKRLSEDWKTLLLKMSVAFLLSLLAFFPGKEEEHYDFESHIEAWPYYFIVFFALVSIVYHGDKVVAKLTEGITLLQSLALLYWVVDYGFVETENIFLQSVMGIGLLFSLYSAIHAFTPLNLSRTNRLTLSVWSSLIMLLFAADNLYRVYQNDPIEYAADLNSGLYTGLQYFLLGVSAIYIVQNFLMLIRFLPGRGTFFNAQYFEELRELKDEHVKRYSERQVNIAHSFFCVLFAGTVFALNHAYHLLPRPTAIWMVFIVFPALLTLYGYATRRLTTAPDQF